MNIRFGEIYWLEILAPVGHEYMKKRPFVVVDQETFIARNAVICAVPLTKNLEKRGIYDVTIPKDASNALFYDSTARIADLNSFDKSRFKRYIGTANKEIMRVIMEKVQKRFSF